MAQIEAGEIPIAKVDVELDAFLDDVVAAFRSRAEDHPIRIEAPVDLPKVLLDPNLVALALRQLIDNALKYSVVPSPIRVQCTLHEDMLEIHVADGGPGIGATDRERIFEKYYRRGASNGLVAGTGLGLYIAREIVRAHGGDLWLEDTETGAEFCLSLSIDRKAELMLDAR
jgi:two-component system sensor histidine kinase KdpD